MTETEFINQIKSTIQQTRDEYANDEFVDPNLLWEMVKMKVREESMKYGASKTSKKMTQERENIEQSIETLEKEITNTCIDEYLYRRPSKTKIMVRT